MSDHVTPEEYGLRAAKRQLKKNNASLVEQNLALRSKVSVLAAQLEAERTKAAEATQAHTSLTETYIKVARELEAAQKQIQSLEVGYMTATEAQFAAQKAIAQLEADVEHRDEIIQRLRSGKAA